ncbi:hypothetical protein SAMN05660964_01490 [Thiothrix caldifontis]|uniref:Uncharacterized protein n=1 Tax=Thiothrix caldifontis TaxID=525918 RepID=A0A1H4AUR5_9GAMM|nr:hypothetical protein [Thiothrix caldifontis]SEA39669.1 hypothetical protein SAMN05660964_01490 [Thiothrix caldifontis]
MGAVSGSGKHLVLNNRYALLGCIAVSGAGKIYRGRDLEQVKHQGLESRILIHVLPGNASHWVLDELFQHITATRQRLALSWILAPLAYGQDNGQAYVVLESPDTWEVQSLLNQTDQQLSCQRSTAKRINPLIKERYLDAQIDPALLLCVFGEEVHLLATALSPMVQRLEKRGSHRIMPRKHVGHALMTGSLLTLFAIFTAVAGNAVLETVVSPTPAVAVVPEPSESLQLAALSPLEVVSVLPMNQGQKVYKDTPSMAIIPPSANKTAPKIKQSVATKSVAQHHSLPSTPTSTAVPVKKKAMPTEQTPSTDSVLQTDDSIDSLIQQAYAAMNAGNLGGGSNSALYFTRKLREQSPNHPQVARLGQEMAAATLRQVRVALKTQNLEQAERLLPISRQLIREFYLNHLQAAQQVLEDKTLELRTHL